MSLDTDLSLRFGELTDAADDSSWAEVVCRANALRRRRRFRAPVAIAAALALAVVVAAPAVGLRGKIVRLLADTEPVPQRIEKSFAAWNEGVPANLGPQVQAKRAMRVLSTPAGADRNVVLWLAPLTRGGFCTLLEVNGRGGGGGCERLDSDRLSVAVSLHGRVTSDGSISSGPVLLDGYTDKRRADSLRLRFEDGETATIPLVWVSGPVNTGFFVYAVPKTHWTSGHLPTTLTLLAIDGDELDHREIHGIPTAGSFSPEARN